MAQIWVPRRTRFYNPFQLERLDCCAPRHHKQSNDDKEVTKVNSTKSVGKITKLTV